jgi:hypothetical protein
MAMRIQIQLNTVMRFPDPDPTLPVPFNLMRIGLKLAVESGLRQVEITPDYESKKIKKFNVNDVGHRILLEP